MPKVSIVFFAKFSTFNASDRVKAAIIFFLVDILGVCMQTLKIVQIRPCNLIPYSVLHSKGLAHKTIRTKRNI